MRHAARGVARASWLREWPLLLVLTVGAGGLALSADPDVPVRRGLLVLAGALALGAVLRAVLPRASAGLLAIRSRALDVVLMGAGAALLAGLVLLTPPGRG